MQLYVLKVGRFGIYVRIGVEKQATKHIPKAGLLKLRDDMGLVESAG